MTTPPLPQMPPQPPMGYAAPPPPGGGGGAALQKIQGPAVGLIVTGALGLLMSLVSFVMNLLGAGMSGLSGLSDDQMAGAMNMFAGGVGVVLAVIGFLVSAFIIWASLQMKDLRNRTLSMVASVVAMIPCISPCCIIGLPIGIWALITINDPAVKGAFRS